MLDGCPCVSEVAAYIGSGPWGRWTKVNGSIGQIKSVRDCCRREFPGGRGIQTVGISVATLERWRAEILAKPSGDEARHRPPVARLKAVIATAAMNQSARSAWCREHGVYPTELETWDRDAISGPGEPRATESLPLKQQERRRIRELARELHRKDKAQAEPAAFLVLSKKLRAIFHEGDDA